MECQYQPHLSEQSYSNSVASGDDSEKEMARGVLHVEMETMEAGDGPSNSNGCREAEDAAATSVSEAAEAGGATPAQLPFSKELITFSLFGKIPAKHSEH
jgi:hypothetical protein